MRHMSTGTTSTIVIYAYTDRGDIPTRVLSYRDLPELLAEVLRKRSVGTVLIEIDGVEVARGDSDNTEEFDEYLMALTA